MHTAWKLRVPAVLLLVLAMLSVAPAAMAAQDPDAIIAGVLESSDPQAAYDALSEEDQAAFDAQMLPVKVIFTTATLVPADDTARNSYANGARPVLGAGPASLAASDGCWLGRGDGSAQAAAGNTLYTFFTTGEWCISGGVVTTASLYQAGGETATPGWRYEGTTASGSDVINNEGRSFASHNFILGSYGIDIQNVNECQRVDGLSNANYVVVATCSLV